MFNHPIPLAADGNWEFDWPGGRSTFDIEGTWGSGTAKLQYLSKDGSTWVDLIDLSFTANGQNEVVFRKCRMRLDLSGSTSPSLYPSFGPIRER